MYITLEIYRWCSVTMAESENWWWGSVMRLSHQSVCMSFWSIGQFEINNQIQQTQTPKRTNWRPKSRRDKAIGDFHSADASNAKV